MDNLTFAIAGMGFTVLSDRPALLRRLAQDYQLFLADTQPQMTVRVNWNGSKMYAAATPEAIFGESDVRLVGDGYQGVIYPQGGRADLTLDTSAPLVGVDYFLRVAVALMALESGGLMIHAAGIVRNQRAYLFFGHSGSGKTTVSRLSAADLVLNDDLIVLMKTEAGWAAHATPFWNPTQVKPTAECAPLAALFRLVQDKTVYAQRMGLPQALAEVVASIPVLASDPLRNRIVLARSLQILRDIPAYQLHFLPDASFWQAVEAV